MVVSLDDLANPNIGMTDPLPPTPTDPDPHSSSLLNWRKKKEDTVATKTLVSSGMPAHLRPPLIITDDTSKDPSSSLGMPALLTAAHLPSPTVQVCPVLAINKQISR